MGRTWITVPNTFPYPDDLDAETWYHLFEGYGVSGEWETKSSGKYYKRIRILYGDREDTLQLISALGFGQWWLRIQPDRSLLGRIFGLWKKRD